MELSSMISLILFFHVIISHLWMFLFNQPEFFLIQYIDMLLPNGAELTTAGGKAIHRI